MNCDQLVSQTLALDLEATRGGNTIRQIGALCGERCLAWAGGRPLAEALRDLEDFGQGAGYLLGHNLLAHDLPLLQNLRPDLKLLRLPVIDTLYLSPLAFPRNPYHRLVKNYKLVRSTINDPVEDARLSLILFRDQYDSFMQQGTQRPELLAFYRFCFHRSRFGAFSGQGIAELFELLRPADLVDAGQAKAIFLEIAQGSVCATAVEATLDALLGSPSAGPAAAYALAWLRVAGANSVLPPWVRHQFPQAVPLLRHLRDLPCERQSCSYCRETHDPDRQLKRFFGFERFRDKPATQDGASLQRAVVMQGLRDVALMAILPTGGGKSLCFQLPALVRHLRRGLLTVVFSPLQALMKDQLDNLIQNTGTPFAGAIYGLLTPPERGEVLERVRLGDVAILYISPEQLRSRSVLEVLKQREIGCWVFDEAHCLSKWGHDFRPDYLYAARFIREFAQQQNLPLPPIACFTATAKLDVIEEIRAYFRSELNLDLLLFEGGVERDNLDFEVWPVSTAEKLERTYEAIAQQLGSDDPGTVIVYAATVKTTEEIRDYLRQKEIAAELFHGRLEANVKRRLIEQFVAGEIPVICATNAFGMGIDKQDIRLVLHYDIPGSLENYLQEAGRAGRDRLVARCVLLYCPEDAEKQFGMAALSEIRKEDIERILRCLRRARRNREEAIVITPHELMRDEELLDVFAPEDRNADTRIKTAVSWLERSGFLQRDQNLTQMFQGKPLVNSLDQAEPHIQRLGLSPEMQNLWRGILHLLFNSKPDELLSADSIAELLLPSLESLKTLERKWNLSAAQIVIQAMHDMAQARLIDKGLMLSAYVRPKGQNSAPKVFETIDRLEARLLKCLQEEAPDAATDAWLELDISRLNQRLLNDGEASNPLHIKALLKGLKLDGEGLAGSHGSIELQHTGRNRYRVKLKREWPVLIETATLRRDVARTLLTALIDKIKSRAEKSGKHVGLDILIEFSASELVSAIEHDIVLHSRVKKYLAAVDRGLMFLHEHKVIQLQQGLGVFRQAMTIRLTPEAKGRKYTLGDYKPLAVHFRERRFQVHVMMEYAALALDKIAGALRLVLDYFSLKRSDFVRRYFAGREELIAQATSAESYRLITESLNNPVQIGIVGSPPHANRLILAGPGAGKTRVVVHRCAYLLRVERIKPNRILVMCFNHSAAVLLRKRLDELVGRDARGVTIVTYHGAALRLTGTCLREQMQRSASDAAIDFNALIREAVALLKGETPVPGLEPDEVRDRLLDGYSHILVDEYQDIDADQYELVSAIAGRTLAEGEGKLSILAVGDDDQNIYAFRGANVEFIRRFHADYHARIDYLVENYRSSAHIIAAGNQLIAHNRDRMKGGHPIRINRQRLTEFAGGIWQHRDPVCQGRVQRLLIDTLAHQAPAVIGEMQRLRSLDPDLSWERIAVLGRTNRVLAPLRALCEQHGIAVKRSLAVGLPLHRIREVERFIVSLKAIEPQIRRASSLAALISGPAGAQQANPWISFLNELLSAYRQESGDAELPVTHFLDWFFEALAEQRREKTLGHGLFLNTIHAAKGMEFDHVVVLDGDWYASMDRQAQEEERRLLYVAMTRARQTLCLLECSGQGNPLLQVLEGKHIVRRQAAVANLAHEAALLQREYRLLGLQDIFLGYAGSFPAGHPVHQAAAALEPGQTVKLVPNGTRIEVRNHTGTCFAKLSRECSPYWLENTRHVLETRIVGMMKWSREDTDEAFLPLLKADCWEVPILEIVLGKSNLPLAGKVSPNPH